MQLSMAMKACMSSFPIFTTNPRFYTTNTIKHARVSTLSPPTDFDYRAEILSESRAAIAKKCPELLDMADDGCLVLVEKRQFGPVPPWRKDFVEPEEIWLIGTNHISEESVAHVERVIRAVRPDNVVVELCKSRAGIMYSSGGTKPNQQLRTNMFSMSGTGFFGAVGRSIDLGGQTALALRLLLAMFSSKVSSDVNRPFGDEFRAARKSSEEIGAQLVLGDRPIEITLQRAWSALKWTEKLSLLKAIFNGIIRQPNAYEIDLKKTRSDDTTFQLYEQLSFSYPSLLQPLLHERDTCLAWSLKRSKAVNNCKSVVGVIGKGHLNGIIYALISDQGNLRFRDLVGQRAASGRSGGWIKDILKGLLRDTIIGILLWALYEQINKGL